MAYGKNVVEALLYDIKHAMETYDWQPEDVSGLSTMHFVEVKAMLINAEKKLLKIAKNEGYTYE